MSKSNTFENDLLKLIFNAVAIANIADNAGVGPLTDLFAAMHTADPGEAGDQTSNEATYTSYARVAIPRDATGFTVAGNQVTLTSTVNFPKATGAGDNETLTHFSIGVAVGGASKILYSGPVDPNIVVTQNVTPQLGTGTTITED